MKKLVARLAERCYTSSQWELLNPVLAAGEIGINLTTNQIKIGNGIQKWSSLHYMTNTSETLIAGEGVKISGNSISTILTYEVLTDKKE